MAIRAELKELGVKVSVNDIVIKAAAMALRDVPEVNVQWVNGGLQQNSSIDISVAVATDGGLITPIVTSADEKGLGDINASVMDLATRARAGQLAPAEYQGGSFSISNLGMFGVSEFSAVINPPQAAILAVGGGIQKIVPTAVSIDDIDAGVATAAPTVTSTITMSLSSDSRAVSGATAARFMQTLQAYMNSPKSLLM